MRGLAYKHTINTRATLIRKQGLAQRCQRSPAQCLQHKCVELREHIPVVKRGHYDAASGFLRSGALNKVGILLVFPTTSSSSFWMRACASGWQAAAMIISVIPDAVWNGIFQSMAGVHDTSGEIQFLSLRQRRNQRDRPSHRPTIGGHRRARGVSCQTMGQHCSLPKMEHRKRWTVTSTMNHHEPCPP